MLNERLLALIKQGAMPYPGAKNVDAERLGAAGLLCQWLTEHLKAGGEDPRFMTRAGLLSAGVPLQCKRKAPGSHKPAGSFCWYRSSCLAERKQQHGTVSKQQYMDEMTEIKKNWSELDGVGRRDWIEQARDAHNRAELRRLQEGLDSDGAASNPAHAMSCSLWGLNTRTAPFAVDRFVAEAKDICCEESLPGYRRYCRALRDRLAEDLFVSDAGPWVHLL